MTQHIRFSFLALVTGVLVLSLGTTRARADDAPPPAKDAGAKGAGAKGAGGTPDPSAPVKPDPSAGGTPAAPTALTAADLDKALTTKLAPINSQLTKMTKQLSTLATKADLDALTARVTTLEQEAAVQKTFMCGLAKLIADWNAQIGQNVAAKANADASGAATSTHNCGVPHSCSPSCLPQTYAICAPVYGYPWGGWGPVYQASYPVVYSSGCRLGCR